jgi:hypothetical protein
MITLTDEEAATLIEHLGILAAGGMLSYAGARLAKRVLDNHPNVSLNGSTPLAAELKRVGL